MARHSGFGTLEFLKHQLPRLIDVFEKINKNLELIVNHFSSSDKRIFILEEKMEAVMKTPVFNERLEKSRSKK